MYSLMLITDNYKPNKYDIYDYRSGHSGPSRARAGDLRRVSQRTTGPTLSLESSSRVSLPLARSRPEL